MPRSEYIISENATPEQRQKAMKILSAPDTDERKSIGLKNFMEAGLIESRELEDKKEDVPMASKVAAYPQAMARGVLKAVSPVPYETVEAAANYPVQALAQSAGYVTRKIQGEPTAPVEPWKESMSQAQGATETLKRQAPGAMEGAELGTTLAFLAEMVPKGALGILNWAKNRKLPQVTKDFMRLEKEIGQKSSSMMTKETAKIASEREKVMKLSREILDTDDERFLRSVLDRPEKVEYLIKNGELSPDELARRVSGGLKTIRESLGKDVGKYRAQIEAMDSQTLDPKEYVDIIRKSYGALQTTTGESALSAADAGKLESIVKLLGSGSGTMDLATGANRVSKVAPRDILLAVDKIDEIAPPGEAGQMRIDRGNIGQKAYATLRKLRSDMKQKLRGQVEETEGWIESDRKFHEYMDNARGLEEKFAGDQRETAINNLFGKGKTPVRERLTEALNVGGVDRATRFFNDLEDIKAAQGLKSVMTKRNDPTADRLDRIIKKYERAGAAVGAVVSAAAMSVLPWGMALATAPSMGILGAIGGRKLGNWRSDPMRILEAAKSAKNATPEVKKFADDVKWINETYGPDGVKAFLKLMPQTAAAIAPAQALGIPGMPGSPSTYDRARP